jgi:hypothetical protein
MQEFIANTLWGLLLCLLGKSPTQEEEGRTLWATTHEEEDHNEP